MVRRSPRLALAVGLAAGAVLGLTEPRPALAATCLHATVTITGSGTITGTSGGDAMVGSDRRDVVVGNGVAGKGQHVSTT